MFRRTLALAFLLSPFLWISLFLAARPLFPPTTGGTVADGVLTYLFACSLALAGVAAFARRPKLT